MDNIFALLIIFTPLAFGSVSPWAAAVLEITLFLAAYVTLKQKLWASHISKTMLPAVTGIIIIGLLQLKAEHPPAQTVSILFTSWRPATIRALLLWTAWACLLWSVPQLVRTHGQLKKIIWVFVSTATLVSVLGIFQKGGVDTDLIYGLIPKQGADIFGPFVNRNHAATFLGMAALCGLGLFFSMFSGYSIAKSRSRMFDTGAMQFLALVMTGVIIAGLLRTQSRAGFISFLLAAPMAGILFMFINGNTRAKAMTLITAALLAIFAFGLIQKTQYLSRSYSERRKSVTTRLSLYGSGARMFAAAPAFGSGLGAFKYGFTPYQDRQVSLVVEHVHSDWLELFIETGIAGAALYLAGLLLALKYALKNIRNCPSREVKSLLGGVIGAMLLFIFHTSVDFSAQIPADGYIFYLLLALTGTIPAVYGKTEEEPDGAWLKLPVWLKPAPAVILLVLCAATLPPVMGWYYDFKGEFAPPEQKLPIYAKALFWQEEPRYAFRLGAAYYDLAVKNPDKWREYVSKAYMTAKPYIRRLPYDKNLARLEYSALYSLSRDAR